MRPTYRIATAPSWSSIAAPAGCFPSWRRFSLTAPTAARSCAGPWTMPPGGSRWSSVPRRPRASRSSQDAGSSSAPSPGSIAAAASPRTTKTSTEPPSPSSASPASGSCSEDSPAIVIPHELSGRTLRGGGVFHHSWCGLTARAETMPSAAGRVVRGFTEAQGAGAADSSVIGESIQ